jgi:hypothetical protein
VAYLIATILAENQENLFDKSILLKGLVDLVHLQPGACRAHVEKLKKIGFVYFDEFPNEASRLLSSLPTLSKSGMATQDWKTLVMGTLGSLHSALDSLLVAIDEDAPQQQDMKKIVLDLPNLSEVIPANSSEEHAFSLHWDRFRACSKFLKCLLGKSGTSFTYSRPMPIQKILNLVVRVLSAPGTGASPAVLPISYAKAVAFLPSLIDWTVDELVNKCVIQSAPHTTCLIPFSSSLLAITKRVASLSTNGLVSRGQALSLVSSTLPILRSRLAQELLRHPVSPANISKLSSLILEGNSDAIQLASNVIIYLGQRAQTDIRAPLDQSLTLFVLQAQGNTYAREQALHALALASVMPPAVVSGGISAYSPAIMTQMAVLQHGLVSDIIEPATKLSALLNGTFHPLSVMGSRPIKLVADCEIQEGKASIYSSQDPQVNNVTPMQQNQADVILSTHVPMDDPMEATRSDEAEDDMDTVEIDITSSSQSASPNVLHPLDKDLSNPPAPSPQQFDASLASPKSMPQESRRSPRLSGNSGFQMISENEGTKLTPLELIALEPLVESKVARAGDDTQLESSSDLEEYDVQIIDEGPDEDEETMIE